MAEDIQESLDSSLRSPAFRASDHFNDNKPHVLIACTGSVATIKLSQMLHALSNHNISIRIILTESASQFLQAQADEQPSLWSLLKIRNVEAIYKDDDEWKTPWKRGSSILHIELRRWADVMLIAPLSANSLAKMIQGIADSLVLSVIRAWDTTGIIDPVRPGLEGLRTEAGKKPIIVAPAMNTAMWAHPITTKQIKVLEDDWGLEHGGWIQVLRPVEKELACGDTGAGAMKEWKDIVVALEQHLGVSG